LRTGPLKRVNGDALVLDISLSGGDEAISYSLVEVVNILL
jgi:hypothetical protein